MGASDCSRCGGKRWQCECTEADFCADEMEDELCALRAELAALKESTAQRELEAELRGEKRGFKAGFMAAREPSGVDKYLFKYNRFADWQASKNKESK